ncbi:MAG: hypothetical protein ACTS46_01430 [Candidatus Hodgkinia cicadicola]
MKGTFVSKWRTKVSKRVIRWSRRRQRIRRRGVFNFCLIMQWRRGKMIWLSRLRKEHRGRRNRSVSKLNRWKWEGEEMILRINGKFVSNGC